jgi:hypothetical protein
MPMSPRAPAALAVLLLLLPMLARAQDSEFRSLKLSDGRTLVGQVVESTAEGMVMRLPQGTTLVRYEHLMEIGVVDGPAPDATPLGIAIAPSIAPDSLIEEAARLDSWLHQAVGAIPDTATTSPDAWAELLGDKGFQVLGCSGDLACLQPMAKATGADLLIVPRLSEGPALMLEGYVVGSGTRLGGGSSPLAGTRAELAPHMIRATFTAIGITPEVDTAELAKTVEDGPAFASVEGAEDPAPPVDPEPEVAEPEVAEPEVAEPEVAQADAAEPQVTETTPAGGQLTVVRRPPEPSDGPVPNLGTAVALGFVPVPGLNSAYLRDLPGFIISLVGTVALGAVAVYGLGANIRWERPFAASTVLVPYAIGVTFNQVAGIVGWNRLYGKRAQAAAALRLYPDGASVGPVLTMEPGAPATATGAAFSLRGRF